MDVVSPEKNQNKNTNMDPQKRQNIMFGTLLFVGFSALVLGIFQITGNIGNPLEGNGQESNQELLISNTNSDYDQLVFLKEKDTDLDGLNDYDELYIFGTSPYVADSDGDEISDKVELDAGTDPNCPKGETCIITSVAVNEDNTQNSGTTSTGAELSSQELRATLKQLGAPANVVDAMDDETLKTVYQETIDETGIDPQELLNNTNSASPSETAAQEITVNTLEQLTAPEIRQLLISSGLTEEDLSQIDDETLELLYTQAIQEELY